MEGKNLERIKAPELTEEGGWLNVDRSLSWNDLKGKVVLLDFWAYCCINCLHVLADLKYLEEKFKDELVVIGVHSAKFQNERETVNIRKAILRYQIEHPVVNDNQLNLWKSFTVQTWPSLYVVDPDGYLVWTVSGEGHRELLENTITNVVNEFKDKGSLKSGPFPLSLEKDKVQDSPLSFPGKVHADPETNRLFIADTNHNRIVVTDLDGNCQEIIGTGQEGMDSGKFDQATFNHPQGMASIDRFLYVADTDNHLIRRLDMNMRLVHTVAGVDKKKSSFITSKSKQPPNPLNSPWDVALFEDKKLFIAMAGSHQIWLYDICGNQAMPYAGTGMEGIVDGKNAEAQLAQPSGIKTDGKFVYFADSEVSAIRKVGLEMNDSVVETVVGKGLFEFGDEDGPLDSAKFQHPLGLDVSSGNLYVADTYNHKIKVIDLATGTVSTVLGGNGDPLFHEPSGVSVAGDHIYVADTNNHRICRADLSGNKVEPLEIKGL